MSKEEFEKMVATNQAALDQLWAGAEENESTLNQILGLMGPGLVTQFLRLVSFQINHNQVKRKLESM